MPALPTMGSVARRATPYIRDVTEAMWEWSHGGGIETYSSVWAITRKLCTVHQLQGHCAAPFPARESPTTTTIITVNTAAGARGEKQDFHIGCQRAEPSRTPVGLYLVRKLRLCGINRLEILLKGGRGCKGEAGRGRRPGEGRDDRLEEEMQS